MNCDHCRRLRAYLEEANERLGRPVDTFDTVAPIPFHALARTEAVYAEVRTCPCACHSHLRIVGRWAPASS